MDSGASEYIGSKHGTFGPRGGRVAFDGRSHNKEYLLRSCNRSFVRPPRPNMSCQHSSLNFCPSFLTNADATPRPCRQDFPSRRRSHSMPIHPPCPAGQWPSKPSGHLQPSVGTKKDILPAPVTHVPQLLLKMEFGELHGRASKSAKEPSCLPTSYRRYIK
jgi:hypothetical protein